MGIATTNCRCLKCRKRTTKAHPLNWYIRKPSCDHCGGRLTTDWYRNSGREAAFNRRTGKTCRCGAPDYPHRKGSHPFCQHRDSYIDGRLDRQLEGILTGKVEGIRSWEPPF